MIKNKILLSREKRYLKQKEILAKYQKGLMIISLNIPGVKKNKFLYQIFFKKIVYNNVFNFLKKERIIFLKYHNQKFLKDKAGIYLNLILNNKKKKSLLKIKKKIINLEKTHPIFTLLDIDILDIQHNNIKRSFLKFPPKKCFLCKKQAKICSLQKKHRLKDLILFINTIIKKFLSKN
ncbi:holo-ACP synthase CitX [Candidatus Phytoplasma oryzae]|uniref:citrate lyase holo-[acyl-carrier protein] synthase n=1 Tax=Candidatus Phytoplasma oryzae TaxID=203274 RepID=A0A139JQC8_9MOLU|nr:citrate lyase holo-[acyl-carrier protein] synthase [Candidatus Phytoplasma oryzae]KXT29169.1 holo-ACP synthase CitX [Candidatus Phytoplasma oryzae]